MLSSLVLGAIHALAPGHGKTVMAAYLVGQRGSLRQAMVIALTVTATHTAGVLALGVAISASAVVAPERLYPWLGAASGVLLAAIGVGFLVRILRLRHRAGSHHHHHHHHHDDDHVHTHGGRPHTHGPVGDGQLVSWRGLVAMGFVGGLLPSPSAVVVLLGAIALGRIWFGVLLVTVYGLGMAATLAGAGVLLVRARSGFDRLLGSARRNRLLLASSRLVPSATGVFITAVGLYLAARSAVQI
jgi:ABC-type nickel/cobalt efflux system permease component RcnA